MVRKIAPIAIAFLLVACGGEQKDAAPDGAGSTPPQGIAADDGSGAGAPPAEPLTGDPGRVVAKVGGEGITLHEVDLLASTLQMNRPGVSKAAAQKLALDNLIDQEILLRAAVERGIAASDDDYNTAVAEIGQNFPNEAAFEQAMQQQGMSREDFDRSLRSELTIKNLIEQVFQDTVDVTEAEARAYYDGNPAEFQVPATVHARHILIRADSNAPPEADEAARDRAQAALDRVKGGEDFVAVANEVTEDPSGKGSGGDLGFFPRERMVPPFSEAAFALQPGQVSDLVRTQFGYHVIKVEERRDPGMLPFEEISARLIQNLEQQTTSMGVRSFLEQQKAGLEIEREL